MLGPFDLRSGQAVGRFLCSHEFQQTQRAADRRTWLDCEPGFERAHVGSKIHGGSAAAPMIADVSKDIYKGQMIAGRSQRRAQEQSEIRRSEPVEEEDESD